jgi:hypothetical protein
MGQEMSMDLYERVGHIHIHTVHSDGNKDYEEIAGIANEVGLDYLIVTDHNFYTSEKQGWYRRTLVLTGEEVADPGDGGKNHYLVMGAGQGMAPFVGDPQQLIDAVRRHGGLGFLAHPCERSGALIDEPEIDWTAWNVEGYDGLEIWNYMSEFKSCVDDLARTLLYVLIPSLAIRGPFPETLNKWDELLADHKVWGIGGSDTHGETYQMGPLRRIVFDYDHLFGTINTHALLSEPWNGRLDHDAELLYEALGRGRAFVGYDALSPTKGFSFEARHAGHSYTMGDEVTAQEDVHFDVHTPSAAHLRLMLNGFCVAESRGKQLTHTSRSPGAYRVEVLKRHMFAERGWIYSNPIFVKTRERR